MNVEKFIKEFHDYLAPKLDTYEQAIYLYIIRHSRLLGKDVVVIGFKSARKKFAFGIGKKGTPLSEGTCYEKLKNLEIKQCLKIHGAEYDGTRVQAYLPDEIKGVIPEEIEQGLPSLEEMDFFDVKENRKYILERENHKCFYCLRELTSNNYVIEHVTSRPQGDNTYQNLVAACRDCNNKKGSNLPDDFLRTLYREGFLSEDELENRISHLERLKIGELKPNIFIG